jgi:hypothetical protein
MAALRSSVLSDGTLCGAHNWKGKLIAREPPRIRDFS